MQRLALPVGITATGQFFPDRVVTNDDLARMVDTNDEWIRTRTGIRRRHWVEPGVASSDLGAGALKMALERRGISLRAHAAPGGVGGDALAPARRRVASPTS